MPKLSPFSAAGANRKPKKPREHHDKPFSKEEDEALKQAEADLGSKPKPAIRKWEGKRKTNWKPLGWMPRVLAEIARQGSIAKACRQVGANYTTVRNYACQNAEFREKIDQGLAQYHVRQLQRKTKGKGVEIRLSPKKARLLMLGLKTL